MPQVVCCAATGHEAWAPGPGHAIIKRGTADQVMLGTVLQPEQDAPRERAPSQGDMGQLAGTVSLPARLAWAGLALSSLTLEMLLYAAIFLVALAVRLGGLGQWPLTEVEANTALAAWRTVQGSTWRPAYYLPLLYDADLLLFWAFRATDAAARLLPALAGAGFVLLPYAARDLLGRKAALVASLFLALGPSWVYFSRAADGAILVAAAGAVLLLSTYRAVRSTDARDFRLGAAALALGLVAGPQVYTLLGVGLLLLAGWAWLGRGSGRWLLMRGAAARLATRENVLIFLATFLFFASGMTFNPGGIGASLNLAGRWAQSLSPAQSGLPWFSYPRNLLLYEALTVVLAVAGGIWGVRRRAMLDYALLAWAAIALALGILGQRQSPWLLGALLPLTLLAARGAQELWDALVPGASVADLAIIALLAPVLAFVFLQVAAFTRSGEMRYLDYARIVLGALLVLWAAYAIWGRRESAQRVGAALILLVLVSMTLRSATAVAYQTARDPREALVGQPVASIDMRDLLKQVTTLSSRQAGDPHVMSLDYEDSLDPWLSWYLRDFPNSRALPAIGPQPSAMALLTPLRVQEAWPVGYMGQSFRWRETRPQEPPDLRQQLRWFIYRDPWGDNQASKVHLWVRSPALEKAQ